MYMDEGDLGRQIRKVYKKDPKAQKYLNDLHDGKKRKIYGCKKE